MTMKAWPDFESLETSIFPDWIKTSVLDLTKEFPEKLDFLYVEFWATNYYDDNNNVKKHAGPSVGWKGTAPTEDELDHIPAMRRMERRAEDLWSVLPVEVDHEANICGEVSYIIDRTGLQFISGNWEDENHLELFAIPKDNGWHCGAKIIHPLEDYINGGVSDTTMITMDADAIVAELNPSMFSLAEFPKPQAIYTDENDCICIEFKIEDYVAQWHANQDVH